MEVLKNKRILLTGGSAGIGEAIVRMAAAAGARVVFTGRDQVRLDKVAAETGAAGIIADVSVPADNARVASETLRLLGGIDVLVNNAAFGYGAPIGELDVDRMKAMFDTNIFGLVDLTNRIVPAMKSGGGGDIVNIASTSGMKGHANGTAYSGSKWALRGISQCWQAELRPHDIRVVCVCPSEVQTGWGGHTGRDNPKKLFAEDIARVVLDAVALPRRVMLPEFAVFATNPF
jgi:3-oxoacyl-[acyl-carrier protein] reductase